MHEAQMHKVNSFVTLTYSDKFVPDDYSLNYKHFQDFMKRLRKRLGSVRYYMCGEYGEDFGRPHFHALLFGCDFYDKVLWSTTPAGSKIYRSRTLEELWPNGYSSIGDVTFESAGYVSRYVMKKVTGLRADDHYTFVSPVTGEIFRRRPEFNKMSLKPGIGFTWFQKFCVDVYPHDYVIVNGKPVVPPRYYDKLLKSKDLYEYDEVFYERYLRSLKCVDNTEERLYVREQVASERLKFFKRSI